MFAGPRNGGILPELGIAWTFTPHRRGDFIKCLPGGPLDAFGPHESGISPLLGIEWIFTFHRRKDLPSGWSRRVVSRSFFEFAMVILPASRALGKLQETMR